MAEGKSRKDLVEEAFNLIVKGDKTNLAVAIVLLKKAKETYQTVSGGYECEHIELYIKFIETNLGLKSSKEDIPKIFLNGLRYYTSRQSESKVKIDKLEIDGQSVTGLKFGYEYREFFENNMVENWLKSLKYDALVRQIKEWEEDGQADKEKLDKIKAIIGE